MRYDNVLAGTVVVGLVLLGGGVGLGSACAPDAVTPDGGADSPVCNPDSGDSIGCPCDPSKYGSQECYTGPLGTEGKGICQTGKRTCNPDGTLSACEGEVTPQPEICNLADDNCDGIVDNVQSIVEAGTIFNCSSPACDPLNTDASITCWGPSLGICGAGSKACVGGPKGGSPTGCTEFVNAGVMEVCNGLDDDCNGIIDDGLNNDGPCTLDAGTPWSDFPDVDLSGLGPDASLPSTVMGQCLNGNLTCTDTNCATGSDPNAGRVCYDAGDQCFPSSPVPETCNGLDDNCNGVVDEGSCLVDKAYGESYCCSYVEGASHYGFCVASSEVQYYTPPFYTCNYAW
jgi:Putative metal-binding motif